MKIVSATLVFAVSVGANRVRPKTTLDASLVQNSEESNQEPSCRRRRCLTPAPLPPSDGGESASPAAAAAPAAAEPACRRRRCPEGTAGAGGEGELHHEGGEPESGRRRSQQFDQGEEGGRRRRNPPPPLDAEGQRLGPECQRYLDLKKYPGPQALYDELSDYVEPHRSGTIYDWHMPCPINQTAQDLYHPNPAPNLPGSSDTTDMACQFGNIAMHETFKTYTDERGRVNRQTPLEGGTCCGVKPHFNWIIGTCEKTQGEGQFCATIPDCAKSGSPKINYLAAYQFDGQQFVMMDESTAGEIHPDHVSGNYWEGTGWISQNMTWNWRGGDWTQKYAPWAREKGKDGPRGITPPAGLFVLSAENFYYAALYMLSQVNINLEGHGQPTDTNCWLWELDPVEGSVGWHQEGTDGPGNLNMLYGTNNAQVSGCMPLSYTAKQTNGLQDGFHSPKMFEPYCTANPEAPGCQPSEVKIDWSGGRSGSQRWEQFWDEPYVFAVVLDSKGSWTYRWIPEEDGTTGWPGVSRHRADRTLVKRPRAVTDPEGLETDVRGHVREALILQPGLDAEESCLRSSAEEVNWAFGSETLGSMAHELGENGRGGKFEGAQNWWNHFVDTEQMQDYPIEIMGIEKEVVRSVPHSCNSPSNWACDCRQAPKETNEDEIAERTAEYQVARSQEHADHNAELAAELAEEMHQHAERDAQHAHGEGQEDLSPGHSEEDHSPE